MSSEHTNNMTSCPPSSVTEYNGAVVHVLVITPAQRHCQMYMCVAVAKVDQVAACKNGGSILYYLRTSLS